MRVVITGGAGFVGYSLGKNLAAAGAEVVLFDKVPASSLPANTVSIEGRPPAAAACCSRWWSSACTGCGRGGGLNQGAARQLVMAVQQWRQRAAQHAAPRHRPRPAQHAAPRHRHHPLLSLLSQATCAAGRMCSPLARGRPASSTSPATACRGVRCWMWPAPWQSTCRWGMPPQTQRASAPTTHPRGGTATNRSASAPTTHPRGGTAAAAPPCVLCTCRARVT